MDRASPYDHAVASQRMANAKRRAAALGFEQSSVAGVGRLLAVLAASVPEHGRILEIGTGVGAATAWMVDGLAGRSDVEVVTVESDPTLSRESAEGDWPAWVRFAVGDALEVIPNLGQFDLVFADAVAGKWYGLDVTINALSPRGVLVVDDMLPPRWADAEHELRTREVREMLLHHERLTSVEMDWSTGLIVSTRRAT